MKKRITVDKALIRYNQIHNILVINEIIAFFAVVVFTIFYFSIESIVIIIVLYLVLTIILTEFIVMLSPRLTFNVWKFWAFNHVGNVHELKNSFYKWEEIENCVISPGNKAGFRYTHSRGNEGVYIQELNIKNNGIKLSKLLLVYRERNKLQNSKK